MIDNPRESIERIRPNLDKLDGIEAHFTLKNEHITAAGSSITGLNLGMNTSENPSVIEQNRHLLFRSMDTKPEQAALAHQVHGTDLKYVNRGGLYPETDGLVTNVRRLLLCIQVADCAAVLLADPVNGVAGAVHAGWRGAAGNIVPAAVALMHQHGAEPDKIHAYISPCISQKHFEVGVEVAERFPRAYVDYEQFKKPHVDLKGFIADQLSAEGLEASNIQTDEGCTVESKSRFYSYRRKKNQSGRMMGVIQLT